MTTWLLVVAFVAVLLAVGFAFGWFCRKEGERRSVLGRLAEASRVYIEAFGETDDDSEMNAFNDLVDATNEAEAVLA